MTGSGQSRQEVNGIALTARRLCRGDHLTVMLRPQDLTMEAVAAGSRFIDEVHPWIPCTKLAPHAGNSVRRVGDFTPEPDLATAPGVSHRHRDRILVDIKAHECAIIRHGSSPLCMRHCDPSQPSFKCAHRGGEPPIGASSLHKRSYRLTLYRANRAAAQALPRYPYRSPSPG